jgi:hypothetical protein
MSLHKPAVSSEVPDQIFVRQLDYSRRYYRDAITRPVLRGPIGPPTRPQGCVP